MNTKRYKNGKIYKLVNNVDDELYVGATCMPLAKRKSGHKKDAEKAPNRKVYSHLNHIGWGNVDIILIEAYACLNKMELEKRERHYIEQLKPSLNKNIPTRTKQEYRQNNRDKLLDQKKVYRENNREQLRQKAREYKTKNKDVINERKRLYREKNKDAINAKLAVLILCQCGGKTTYGHKLRHERTSKHIKYLETLKP